MCNCGATICWNLLLSLLLIILSIDLLECLLHFLIQKKNRTVPTTPKPSIQNICMLYPEWLSCFLLNYFLYPLLWRTSLLDWRSLKWSFPDSKYCFIYSSDMLSMLGGIFLDYGVDLSNGFLEMGTCWFFDSIYKPLSSWLC